jgi:hypothetical protein
MGDGVQQRLQCPIHQGSSGRRTDPAAQYYPEDDCIYCFRCGHTWNVVTLIMARLSLTWAQAYEWLTIHVGARTLSPVEQVTTVLRHRVGGGLEAQIDQIDDEVTLYAKDGRQAALWWMGLDQLRAELRSAETAKRVPGRLAHLRKRMQEATCCSNRS